MDKYSEWRYIDGQFVTGHVNRAGIFVNIHPGEVEFTRDALGNIRAILVPAKGIVIDPVVLPAAIVNVAPITTEIMRVIDVEVNFYGEKIQLYVGHCQFDTPEPEKVVHVASFKKITGYLVCILVAIVACKIFSIQLSDLDIVIALVIHTVVYTVTIGFREKMVLNSADTN